ncbi:hypothetical protein [Hymenobacter nivis]|uniref:Uncharacterized protein n=1 Tax=Hymenobacter nivis TaxID=1850093 RepID=A0A2Z3GJD4_9BACT|nr:hypothetical protein [Hymenobacter nivis]AWM32092.1 hypothetical protein DDQ68_04355 [Hymenobacter nivis]
MPFSPDYEGPLALYQTWKQKGVTWGSNPTDIASFLANQFSGFDLFELLTTLEAVALGRNFEWTAIKIEVMPSGNLRIEHQYDNPDDEEPLILIRTLHHKSPRRASHEEMSLPLRLQRQGLSRRLIGACYKQYKQAKVDLMTVQAGMTGGGYAWARYGFAAVQLTEVQRILDTAAERGIDDTGAIQELREDLANFREQAVGPFPIESWARLPFGEKLLAGTQWEGVLNLRNPAQIQ